MEALTIRHLNFCYPESDTNCLTDISFSVNNGDFITLCGASGSGKTTLLRQLKPALTPHGQSSGQVLLFDKSVTGYSPREQATKIGYVMQSPDGQLVTDKVWHELAFGLESLGYPNSVIRRRVAETADFFGLSALFERDVNSLSGGQKQLLNLASVAAMQPDILILDEPTAQLDPIAAADFLASVAKINRELGTTVIISEHRLEDILPISDRVLVLEQGRIISYDTPQNTGRNLQRAGNSAFQSMPSPMRIWYAVETNNDIPCPVTIAQGREWLKKFTAAHQAFDLYPEPAYQSGDTVLQLKHIFFRYQKDAPDVLKDLSLTVKQGDFIAVLGGNGAGKSTLLSILGGTEQPYSGTVIQKTRAVALPQNPQMILGGNSVTETLLEAFSDSELTAEEKNRQIHSICRLLKIEHLLTRHPFDLSGGEQQKAAFAKVLLLKPRLILLDEPTKGMDTAGKNRFARILQSLIVKGVSVVMVSHDVEFCAQYAKRCMLLFNGEIVSEDTPRRFFSSNSFYVTAANRMARGTLNEAVTVDDVIYCCTGKTPDDPPCDFDDDIDFGNYDSPKELYPKYKTSVWKKITAVFGAILLIIGCLINTEVIAVPHFNTLSIWIKLSFIAIPLIILIISVCNRSPKIIRTDVTPKNKLSKRTVAAAVMILLTIPLTIFVGVVYLRDQKYLFISLLILFECMIPFFLVFEGRKPSARELVMIAVLCAITIAGRSAFFMLPQIKPVIALVILSGISLGGETGFIVGAVTMLVSNIYFGQGSWTPWQMFAAGLIGFISGVFFQKKARIPSRMALSVYGFIVTILIYGGIMNFSSLILTHAPVNYATLTAFYVQGLPMDIIHALSTAVILWLISNPMLRKLDRIKTKYGLL